ncbi:hypothetical protein [Flaviaesturariibacter aridisoli]|uniref:Uncharacterized protein n=1 Tax=Flaviaesturariibacter aridisoli TaxID=2545761 RepID=A0A4R4E5F3_9BACT|nr:hypothetical protein [Flaviaesturariibacter aridisoli]TCZ74864.1 hypothetical protein E0486_00735 [Flaviaesturariibacter aridisoli]
MTANNATRVEEDLNMLLQYLVGFGSELLEKYGEFFPVGAYIDVSGELVPLAVYDGEEKPDSEMVIAQLQQEFYNRVQAGNALAWAVAFDAQVESEEYPKGTDAVVANTFHTLAEKQLQYTFPYVLTEGNAEFAEDWWFTYVD